jgi:hypothetical protein
LFCKKSLFEKKIEICFAKISLLQIAHANTQTEWRQGREELQAQNKGKKYKQIQDK